MSTNEAIHAQITELITAEKELRAKLQHREIEPSEERERLRGLEAQLDQCWDLLRQRDALRAIGGNPDDASVRPQSEVEGYIG